MENIDGWEVTWSESECTIKFTDIFGDGELYRFGLEDTLAIRDALSTAIKELRSQS